MFSTFLVKKKKKKYKIILKLENPQKNVFRSFAQPCSGAVMFW